MFKRLAQATVWARSGVQAEDWRYRGIFRFVLPATDLLFVWFGIVGITAGLSSVQAAAGYPWQIWWSAGIALSAFLAFIGVAFPKLWSLELVAKIILVALVSAYVALSLAVLSATTGLLIILILLPVWRVGDLGFVAWQHGHPPEVRS